MPMTRSASATSSSCARSPDPHRAGIVEARLAPTSVIASRRAHDAPMVIFERDGQNRVAGFSIDSDAVRDLIFKRAF